MLMSACQTPAAAEHIRLLSPRNPTNDVCRKVELGVRLGPPSVMTINVLKIVDPFPKSFGTSFFLFFKRCRYMVRQIDFEKSDVSNPFALIYLTLLFKKLALGKISSGWKSGKIVPTAYGMASSLVGMNHM
jgi:hypothetical protein